MQISFRRGEGAKIIERIKSQKRIFGRTRGGEWKPYMYAGKKSSVSINRKLLPLKWVGRACSFKKDNLEACLSKS